jgi:hypothetical protein
MRVARHNSAEQLERDNRALKLRRQGAPYSAIAAEIGWKSASAAHDAVCRALNREPSEDREQLRKLEVARLDGLERVAWKVLERFHYVVITSGPHAGDIVYSPPEDGSEPLIDSAPVLGAIDRLLRISRERRALLGLDAPRKAQVTVITEDAVDAAIRQLEQELANADAPA